MSHNLPNCPTCDTPVHRAEAVGGYVSYQCDNEACEHFPETGFLEEIEARKQWLAIFEANKPSVDAANPLPCPFCGSDPTIGFIPKELAAPELDSFYHLSCDACGRNVGAFGESTMEAIQSWNTRAPLPTDH